MNIRKRIIIPSLAILLASNLYAAKLYTVESSSLKDAILKISKTADMPYLVDTNILKGKTSKSIKNIEGLENALDAVLEGSGLKAIIKNKMIMIKKTSSNNSSSLGEVDVIANKDNITENSESYTIDSMNTATKLNLSLKDTPQSIKVITNQKIKDNNLDTFEDVAASTAGMSMQKYYMTNNKIYSRGFNVDYYQVDGVPTVYNNEGQESLVIYDRVEIVKGANGLVTGAGNPAASINYVKKHANIKEFKGLIELEIGSWNAYGTSVDLASKLNEDGSLRGRIIASYKQNDSFIDVYNEDKSTIYGAFEADLSDSTLLSFTLSKQEFNNYNFTGAGLPIYFSDGSLSSFSRSSNFGGDDAYHNFKKTSASSKLEHMFNNDIKVIANYSYSKSEKDEVRFWERNAFPNITTGNLTLSEAWNDLESSESNSLDIYSSIPFSLANRNHELVAGLMYSKNKIEGEWNLGGNPLTSSVYNWNSTTSTPNYTLDEKYEKETEQSAFYSVGKFSLSDDLKLILGARVSTWEYIEDEEDFTFKNNITPFAGVVYDLNAQHSVYSSYTSIFKPQTDTQDTSGKHLDPKEGNNYEIGLKSSFFNDSLNSGITLFRIEQDNLAVEDGSNVIVGTSDQAHKLVDGVISKGIEIEVSGEINDKWNVDFGLSHYSAKDEEGEVIVTNEPKTQITLSSKYTFNKLSLGAGINWQSKFYEIATNPSSSEKERIYQESYYLVNVMANYQIQNNLSLQANVNNLFDKEYYSNIFYAARYRYGDPRNITMKLTYKF